jgi:hypothetical protein
MSEGQTLRNEDNAFVPLSSGRISLLCEYYRSHKALCQAAEKTLNSTPGCLRRFRFTPRSFSTADVWIIGRWRGFGVEV